MPSGTPMTARVAPEIDEPAPAIPQNADRGVAAKAATALGRAYSGPIIGKMMSMIGVKSAGLADTERRCRRHTDRQRKHEPINRQSICAEAGRPFQSNGGPI